jgi:hypothetical protein
LAMRTLRRGGDWLEPAPAGGPVGPMLTLFGQIAQLVEQGIENPRVGGSIPSLATLFFALVSMAACGPPCSPAAVWTSRCERLCCDMGDALAECVDEQFTWSDIGASDRDDFVRRCSAEWDRASAGLTAYEIQQATLTCRDVRRDLRREGGESCESLRALYAEWL